MSTLRIIKTTSHGLETYEIRLNSSILYTFMSEAMAITKFKLLVNKLAVR